METTDWSISGSEEHLEQPHESDLEVQESDEYNSQASSVGEDLFDNLFARARDVDRLFAGEFHDSVFEFGNVAVHERDDPAVSEHIDGLEGDVPGPVAANAELLPAADVGQAVPAHSRGDAWSLSSSADRPAPRWYNSETLPQTDDFPRATVESAHNVQSDYPIAR